MEGGGDLNQEGGENFRHGVLAHASADGMVIDDYLTTNGEGGGKSIKKQG